MAKMTKTDLFLKLASPDKKRYKPLGKRFGIYRRIRRAQIRQRRLLGEEGIYPG